MNNILKNKFGYDQFRPGQETLISATLEGRDVLGIMPTGGGKSLCFQVPAMEFSGLTLVISPLISLMQDQVGALVQNGIPAAYLNSTLTPRQMEQVLQNARNKQYNLLYIAPERLLSPEFLTFAMSVEISMVTVDEAHCISQWGQDFRPSYSQIPQFLAYLPQRPVVTAYTATATERVKTDIVAQLQLVNPLVLVTGFDRENLHFAVEHPKKKMDALVRFLEKHREESGIVYCSTRKNVEKVCEKLQELGYLAAAYHGGMGDNQRKDNQNQFLFDQIKIMVATNAFGMGIDKSNVSFVLHYNMPKDMESYYQEAGRAGRDGSPAVCHLLYSGQDIVTNKLLIQSSRETCGAPPDVADFLQGQAYERLEKMASYAKTSDCLRQYILGYFGEKSGNFCQNCSNCQGDFVITDVTVEAQKILSCVARMGQRFGAKMVMDVLRGSRNQRILSQQFDTLSTYGICKESESHLLAVTDQLLALGYLEKTVEQYPLLQLNSQSRLVLRGEKKVELKELAALKKSDQDDFFKDPLYVALRQLRGKLAQEQQVPAYVIFSDRTLVDMWKKRPGTEEEFLEISGVGQRKTTQYGADFLAVIQSFGGGEAPGEVAKIRYSGAGMPTAEMLEEVEIGQEPIGISLLASGINEVLKTHGTLTISAVKITNYLTKVGYLQVLEGENGKTKAPTPKGEEAGIFQETREIRGQMMNLNLYQPEMQRWIVAHLLEMW